MQNTLYYRDRDPFTGDLIVQGGILGGHLSTHFFGGSGAGFLTCAPTSQVFESWAIMPLEAAGFGDALSAPVMSAIGANGTGGDATLPPGNVVIMKFLLRTAVITSGLYQPKQSYLAVGAVNETWVDSGGHLITVGVDEYQILGDRLAENVGDVLGVGGFAPVRYGQEGSLLHLQGFAEVDGCNPKVTVSYRRSRRPESV